MTKEKAEWEAKSLLAKGAITDPAVEEVLRSLINSTIKVDISLRGWVIITDNQGHESVYWANKFGVSYAKDVPDIKYNWEDIEYFGWGVRALTPDDIGYRVRKWDEWSKEEQTEYREAQLAGCSLPYVADLAIDIATRGEA